MSIKCLVCGYENADTAKFCLNCGSPLEKATTPVATDDEGEKTFLLDRNALNAARQAAGPSAAGHKFTPREAPPSPPPPPPPAAAAPARAVSLPTPAVPPPSPAPRPETPQAPPRPPSGAPVVPPVGQAPMVSPPRDLPRVTPPTASPLNTPALASAAADDSDEAIAPPAAHHQQATSSQPTVDFHEATTTAAEPADDAIPAPVGVRLGAALIDGALMGVAFLAYFFMFTYSDRFENLDLVGQILATLVPVGLTVVTTAVYCAFLTSSGPGQTLGKKLLKIRTINAAGFEQVTFGVALAGGFLKGIGTVVPPLGVLMVLGCLAKPGQGLHDMVLGTKVVME